METTVTDTIYTIARVRLESDAGIWTYLQPILQIAIGGLLAIAGGFAGAWFQAQSTRRVKEAEIMAERRIDACRDALERLITVNTMAVTRGLSSTDAYIVSAEEWFLASRLFLPHPVASTWISLRMAVAGAATMEEGLPRTGEHLEKARHRVARLCKEGMDAVYEGMGVPPPEPEPPETDE